MQIRRIDFTTIDSTNKWAKEHADACDRKQLHVITAQEQTAGRGREGRAWFSPAEQNLYATFLFFIDPMQRDVGNISQLMAVVAAETLHMQHFALQLKWPNDLWIDKKKVGGILTEIFPLKEEGKMGAALGIGINVNMPKEGLNQIAIPATSLSVEKGCAISVEDLLTTLTQNFAQALPIFLEQGFAPFLQPYRNAIAHRAGEKISFHSHKQLLNGKFLEIGIDGRLHLELENGKLMALSSGEILNERTE